VTTGARLLIWEIDETDGFDSAWARLDGRRLIADGRSAGLRPSPYWTTYSLETGDDWVTSRVRAESRWDGGSATLDLGRDERGQWTVNGEPRPDLGGALDCDLAGCPLTNTMPALRHRLLTEPGDHQLLMAFVEIPSLRVVPNRQRYTHVRALDTGGAVITYRSGSFASDLTVDPDGFVLNYPGLGRRVGAGERLLARQA
jgi:hypothetical protein